MNNSIPELSQSSQENTISFGWKKLDKWMDSAIQFAMENPSSSPLMDTTYIYLSELTCLIEDRAQNTALYALAQSRNQVIELIVQAKTQEEFRVIQLLCEGLNNFNILPKPSWFDELEAEEFGREGN